MDSNLLNFFGAIPFKTDLITFVGSVEMDQFSVTLQCIVSSYRVTIDSRLQELENLSSIGNRKKRGSHEGKLCGYCMKEIILEQGEDNRSSGPCNLTTPSGLWSYCQLVKVDIGRLEGNVRFLRRKVSPNIKM